MAGAEKSYPQRDGHIAELDSGSVTGSERAALSAARR
jgi:hypothetical protein